MNITKAQSCTTEARKAYMENRAKDTVLLMLDALDALCGTQAQSTGFVPPSPTLPASSGEVTDDTRCPDGLKKHAGTLMRNVPAEYLLWLLDQGWTKHKYPGVYAYIVKNKKHLESECKDRVGGPDTLEPDDAEDDKDY